MADEVESEKKTAKAASAKGGRKKTASGAGAKRPSSASSTRKAAPKASAGPSGPDEAQNDADQAAPATGSGGGAPSGNGKPSADSDLIEKLWRLVAMIAFGLIGFFAYHAVAIIALAQFIVVLIRDEPNKDLQQAAVWLNAYLNQVLDYLAYRTEEMPFPLGEKPAMPND